MVVDCAAVETGCMLEKFMKVATKYVFIFIFWSRCCCVLLLLPTTSIRIEAERGTGYCFFLLRLRYDCCFLCVYSIAVAAVEKGCMPGKTNITFSFLVAALLPLFTHREGCAEKNKIDVPGTYTKFYFSFSVR